MGQPAGQARNLRILVDQPLIDRCSGRVDMSGHRHAVCGTLAGNGIGSRGLIAGPVSSGGHGSPLQVDHSLFAVLTVARASVAVASPFCSRSKPCG